MSDNTMFVLLFLIFGVIGIIKECNEKRQYSPEQTFIVLSLTDSLFPLDDEPGDKYTDYMYKVIDGNGKETYIIWDSNRIKPGDTVYCDSKPR